MKDKIIIIRNKLGLHIRAANVLVNTAKRFSSYIELTTSDKRANAKSIMELLLLGAQLGDKLNLTVEGDDEEEAFNAVKTLIDNRFGEPE